MIGQAGSISLVLTLNLGLRGQPWWWLWSPSEAEHEAQQRGSDTHSVVTYPVVSHSENLNAAPRPDAG